MYLSNIPHFLIVNENSNIRLKLNSKLINLKKKDLDIEIVVLLNGNYRTFVKVEFDKLSEYQETIIEIPIVSSGLKEGMFDITFDLKINGKYIYEKKQPYLTKLIIKKENIFKTHLDKIKGPTVNQDANFKEKIKSIPFFGWLLRWGYNLLKLNNLKHTVFMQQEQIKNIRQQNQQLVTRVDSMQKENQQLSMKIDELSRRMNSEVSKEITFQSLSFQQRIDQFIFDTKIKLQKDNLIDSKLDTLENLPKSFIDDYYLAFENRFRGAREDILYRCKEYLGYLDLSSVKTALDLGCGRGEWVELLQEHQIKAYGIDLNFVMTQEAKKYGVKNIEAIDAFEFLKKQKDNSIDLITGFHIIEHIKFEKLLVLLNEIKRVLSPNGKVLLETPNPENLLVAAFTFYKDPTHLNPLPSEVVSFMLEYIGFENVVVKNLHPFPENMKIKSKSDCANTMNDYLYKEQDYIVIATK